MKAKLRRLFFDVINEFVAIVLAGAIVVLTLSVITLSCFASDSYVEKNLNNYSSEVVEEVSSKLSELSEKTGFSKEAYANAFDEKGARLVFSKILNNFKYDYETDFTQDAGIYDYFAARIKNYCHENNIDVTEREISQSSSLAVDAVNEVFGGKSTSSVAIMEFARSRKMIPLILVPFLLGVACIIFLDQFNGGRHRTYNFVGMGFSVAGYNLTFVPLYILIKNYIQNFRFCENLIYDHAITDITETVLKIGIAAGIVCIITGYVILFRNYKYFSRKKAQRILYSEELEMRETDYLDLTTEKHDNGELSEKIVSKIDFNIKEN